MSQPEDYNKERSQDLPIDPVYRIIMLILILRVSMIITGSNSYSTVPCVIREIFSEFLMFWNLFHETSGEHIRQCCMRQRGITTLSLNAC